MMDAVNSVTQARQMELAFQIQTAVADKQLDTQELIGEGMVDLLQTAAQVGKAVGKGGSFDAVG